LINIVQFQGIIEVMLISEEELTKLTILEG